MWTYCIAQGTLLNALWWPKCEGNLKKRNVCIHIADSLCSMAETNSILKQLYTNTYKDKKESVRK